MLPALGINWHFHDLISIYCKIAVLGYKIVYLTARSFSEYSTTRKYIESVQHDQFKLPPGPILMYPKSFFSMLKSDVITKTADVFNVDSGF